MKVAIAGGSGFIGRFLTKRLLAEGHEVYILTRSVGNKANMANITYVEWLQANSKPEEMLEGMDAFINLAGENLSSGRWTAKKKEHSCNKQI